MLWLVAFALLPLLWSVPGAAQPPSNAPPVDPLEQWSLEPGRPVAPPPAPGIPQPPSPTPATPAAPPGPAPPPAAGAPGAPAPEAPATSTPEAAPGSASATRVQIVRCRQLLVSGSGKAVRLAALLRDGTTLDVARQMVDAEVDERQRDYVLDDLDPSVRAELESLRPGDWSRPRNWRGRTLLVQVVKREMRSRASLPPLGEGLGDAERERLARAFPTSSGAPPETPPPVAAIEEVAASVDSQATPTYPQGATISGEATVQVDVGRLGEASNPRILSATSKVFEQPALDAAKKTRYKAAKRGGTEVPGTVTLTFKFTAPR